MANFARVREHLEARGFTVSCFATAAEACDYLDRTLDGESIGIGGSVTIRDMGHYCSVRNRVCRRAKELLMRKEPNGRSLRPMQRLQQTEIIWW